VTKATNQGMKPYCTLAKIDELCFLSAEKLCALKNWFVVVLWLVVFCWWW